MGSCQSIQFVERGSVEVMPGLSAAEGRVAKFKAANEKGKFPTAKENSRVDEIQRW